MAEELTTIWKLADLYDQPVFRVRYWIEVARKAGKIEAVWLGPKTMVFSLAKAKDIIVPAMVERQQRIDAQGDVHYNGWMTIAHIAKRYGITTNCVHSELRRLRLANPEIGKVRMKKERGRVWVKDTLGKQVGQRLKNRSAS